MDGPNIETMKRNINKSTTKISLITHSRSFAINIASVMMCLNWPAFAYCV